MDYFVWVAISDDAVCCIDTGFKPETGRLRERQWIASPVETLARLGVDAAEVRHLVISHLHWDHTGNLDAFPKARIVLQDAEMAFWTGRWAGRGQFRHLHTPGDLGLLLEANAEGRIQWLDGDAEVLPGISVHRVGGHSPGMQVVRVETASGHAVIGSDATHFYENIEQDRPFRILHTLPGMYAAFDRINELASSRELVVAGHDPLIFERFPAATDELAGIVARIG
jgi:glyoxylase-like metal-dependent hydrolase (beta-lactamase superfamily II)